MFKGFSWFSSKPSGSKPRGQSLDRGVAANPRSKAELSPSVYVPNDHPGWFLAWKSQQVQVQVTQSLEEVARLGPAEFVSRRPLAGYQEEIVEERKKYKKVTTRDWDTLRAGKVYKGELAFKIKPGQSDAANKVQYLRCLDQRKRVLFISLTARGDFFVASTKELPLSRTLPMDKRNRHDSQMPHVSKGRIQSVSEVGGLSRRGPNSKTPNGVAASSVHMRPKQRIEGINASNLGQFENFLNWQRKMDFMDTHRNNEHFEKEFPRSEIVMRKSEPSVPPRKQSYSRPEANHDAMDLASGPSTRDIQPMDQQSLATGLFEEEYPSRWQFDDRQHRKEDVDAKRKIMYYHGDKPPPKYQDVLDGKYVNPADTQPGLSSRPYQSVWQVGNKTSEHPNPSTKPKQATAAPSVPVLLSPSSKPRHDRAESPKPRPVPVHGSEHRKEPEHKHAEHRKEPKAKLKKGTRDKEEEKGVKKRERFWDDFFQKPPGHGHRAHRK